MKKTKNLKKMSQTKVLNSKKCRILNGSYMIFEGMSSLDKDTHTHTHKHTQTHVRTRTHTRASEVGKESSIRDKNRHAHSLGHLNGNEMKNLKIY